MQEQREHRRRTLSAAVDVSRVYDGDLYVRVNSIGTTGERPFILVPGIGVSSTYFEKLAPHLNEFGPVHALDLPGFGGVPHPDDALSIRQYADLVGRVIDELKLQDPIIVGHSMGSQVVSDLVSRRPELTTLVLIGPVIHPSERRIPTQAIRFLQASWHEPLTVKVLAISAYMFCGFKWFSRILPKMMSYPIEEALPAIAAHTLVIRGEYDAVAPRDWVEQVGELLPSSRLWEIPGAAHSVMYAHAEEVADLCVAHARETVADGDDDTLHVLTLDEPEEEPRDLTPDLSNVGEALKGRVIETVGVIQGDDEKIEEGKTTTAKAIQLETDGEESTPSGS
ncbi:alpha/beta fold hydrolase [Naasia lichenicola]|uniref:Alpha/beta hydrolase n=1 Tax=Naasia lichenicola TaxID=2565933 RepID=A0A4S4FUB9_9MICO|nr:alpha/beta hydrolase [Naasia lichenicola]THG33196.1 alpha/beta hydrolase [Naasia lichenicola]